MASRPQPHVGRTLLEIYWEELDDIMDRLMEEAEPERWEEIGDDGIRFNAGEFEDVQAWAETRGQAQGVAYCIAVMTNPYTPNIDNVREQAMERWEKRHAE